MKNRCQKCGNDDFFYRKVTASHRQNDDGVMEFVECNPDRDDEPFYCAECDTLLNEQFYGTKPDVAGNVADMGKLARDLLGL